MGARGPAAAAGGPAVLLMGPTGSGKSALAVALAERFDAEIISVDSALVYRRMDVGTDKPAPALRRRVPHHLIDILDPHERYSAARFCADARAALEQVRARGRLPILAGGTMLYFAALQRGLAVLPEADTALRARLSARARQEGWSALHSELARVDPAAARRIHPNDPQRIQRALEVWQLTGTPLSELQRRAPARPPVPAPLKLVLAPGEREVLHARIAARFDAMLAAGLVEEVRGLRADPRLANELPSMRAVGYRQVWSYLAGESSFEEMRQRAIIATRQLAKRQLTWLRRERAATWFEPGPTLAGEAARWLQRALQAASAQRFALAAARRPETL